MQSACATPDTATPLPPPLLRRRIVHRKGEELLRAELPRKQEHIIKLQLSAAQQAVYKAYLEVGAGWVCAWVGVVVLACHELTLCALQQASTGGIPGGVKPGALGTACLWGGTKRCASHAFAKWPFAPNSQPLSHPESFLLQGVESCQSCFRDRERLNDLCDRPSSFKAWLQTLCVGPAQQAAGDAAADAQVSCQDTAGQGQEFRRACCTLSLGTLGGVHRSEASSSWCLSSVVKRRHGTRPRTAVRAAFAEYLFQCFRCLTLQGNEEKPANEEQAADVAEERQARKKPIPKDLARRLLDMIEVGRAWF